MLTGTFMIVLDFFIVNVAIPSIQRDLHTGPAGIEWVVTAYGLTYGVGLITGGRLGDRYGRRRMFLIGLARSPSPHWLAGWRVTRRSSSRAARSRALAPPSPGRRRSP